MADYIVKDTELTSVANSIRTAGGTSSLLTFPNGFISAINDISGGGGNPNYVQTITATAENPCVGISAYSLLHALIDNNASAEITLTNENLGVYVKMPISTQGQTIQASQINSDSMSGFEASWDASHDEATARKLVIINNGQITEGTAYASMLTSELTIIWHPLPD